MIQDGTGLFFNEDYACYYGLGTCNVIYNGGASNNFHFENVSFTERQLLLTMSGAWRNIHIRYKHTPTYLDTVGSPVFP